MRFLIVATAVFACAAAAPSGLLLASNGLLAYGAVPVASVASVPVAPINTDDLQAAAIDAHVEASDRARAVVDAVQEINDQAAEIQGRTINAAEDHAWQAVNSAQVAAAEIDGAVAGVSPAAARAAVSPVAAVSYAVPGVSAYVSPSVVASPSLVASSLVSPVVSAYSAPLIAGVAGVAGSQSVSYQSLSQTHPSPAVAYAHNLVYV